MNKCPITYLSGGDDRYSEKGLRLLASGLSQLKRLDYTAEEQRKEAFNRSSKMSVQGVQPKLSAVLNIKEGKFDVVDNKGRYILKPQHYLYPQMPENEDLTMRLAASIGLDVPFHGMIWAKTNSPFSSFTLLPTSLKDSIGKVKRIRSPLRISLSWQD